MHPRCAVAYVRYDKASSAALAIESLNGATLNNGRGPKLKVLLAEAPSARYVYETLGSSCICTTSILVRETVNRMNSECVRFFSQSPCAFANVRARPMCVSVFGIAELRSSIIGGARPYYFSTVVGGICM